MAIVVTTPADAVLMKSPSHHKLEPGSSFRAAPLLIAAECEDGSLVAAGQARITVTLSGQVTLQVVVRALWHARGRVSGPPSTAWSHVEKLHDWRAVPGHASLHEKLLIELNEHIDNHHGGRVVRDADMLATIIARRLAERSRNDVTVLRALRYSIEASLGKVLRGDRSQDLEVILANIIEVSAMCGRAGDEAREAAREGLWVWCTDPAAFRAHQRRLDPTVVVGRWERSGHRRSWFVHLLNGVRHCRRMEDLTSKEISILQSLLNAASTIAVTRDARAQENFNLLAVVAAVLFGLPALIIALYGATSVLPIRTANWTVLAPVAVAGLLASLLAAVLPAKQNLRILRFCLTLAASVFIVAVLTFAGVLVHPAKG